MRKKLSIKRGAAGYVDTLSFRATTHIHSCELQRNY